jgi:hypothetical protein
MKRMTWGVLLLLALVLPARAQMGMDLFRKPTIAKAFHPVVGKGAEYETTSQRNGGARTHTMELSVVGKDTVDGKDAYWMQFASTDDKQQTMVGKSLITPDDFEFHRIIVQIPGQGAMEMPANMTANNRDKMNQQLSDWHSVGTDTITVPAGAFSCEHWKNEKDGSDVWTSEKVTPFGMVKQVSKDSTMVLVKVLDNVPDRITGPVKPFDMQQIMQQMQQQRQHPQQ